MGFSGFLLDPQQQMTLAERELAKPRTAHATYHQAYYKRALHTGFAAMGRLAEAKLYRWKGPDPHVALFEGRWDESEEQLAAKVDWMTNCGARAESHGWFFLLAWARRLQRKYFLAERQLVDAIAFCHSRTLRTVEMWIRSELTLLYADMNRHAEARLHTERCCEIMAAGENWRGLAGHAARAAAVLAAADGDLGEAERWFAQALEVYRQYILPFDAAEAFLYWGRGLLAIGDSHADEKFDAAIEIYRCHNAGQRWIERVESERDALRLSTLGAQSPGASASGESTEGLARFKREGEFWTLTYRGTTFRLKDVKGLAYIAFLLAHPGERIHVHELIARVDGVTDRGSELGAEIVREVPTNADLGDAGDALDQHAQADYRRRLRELTEDVAEAQRLNHHARAERIRRELEFLQEELSAAAGVGGRDRRVSAHVERARGMVTKNIRAGLEKIRSEDAALGRYFATSIKTGYYCAYLPNPEHKISWQL